jgi:RluA family pseudouridine synthase
VLSELKLSSRSTDEYWALPVLFEDDHLLALDKPAGLLTSPDRYDPTRPNLMALLHAGIRAGTSWAQTRALTYLANAHRLDIETSGVLLLAKSKPVLIRLAELFGSEKPALTYLALVQGRPRAETFEVHAKLVAHPHRVGLMRVDQNRGKKSLTAFRVLEAFERHTLLSCFPRPGRTHQIRAHLQYLRLPIAGDSAYGGHPLWLSRLKPNYRLKAGREERPLIGRVALHALELNLPHPVTGASVTITSPWPKDLRVAVKYLRQFTPAAALSASGDSTAVATEPPMPGPNV